METKRLVKWIGDVTDESFKRALDEILTFHDTAPNEFIEVFLSSNGGSIDAGLAFYDAIRRYKPRLMVVGSGTVGSVAPLILAAGEVRILTEHTTLFFHNIRVANLAAEGPLERKVLLATAHDVKLQTQMYSEILVTRSKGKLSSHKLWALIESNAVLTVKKAITLGIADYMGDKEDFGK